VFTGHLLEALDGKAADPTGILTANGVVAYVYKNVASDPGSQQTPHFGYLAGDGDLIFSDALLTELTDKKKTEAGELGKAETFPRRPKQIWLSA